MTILTSSGQPDLALDSLLDACATFDASDDEQRVLIRVLVVPMLTRKLEFLRIALRAKPQSESMRAMHESVAQAVHHACAKLDGSVKPRASMAKRNAFIAEEGGGYRKKRGYEALQCIRPSPQRLHDACDTPCREPTRSSSC
jgi:hypothetical protein